MKALLGSGNCQMLGKLGACESEIWGSSLDLALLEGKRVNESTQTHRDNNIPGRPGCCIPNRAVGLPSE
jgi:hypothetical protein